MTFSIGNGESLHNPGPITEGLLNDIGWVMGASSPTQVYMLTVQSQNPDSGMSIQVTPNDNNGFGNGTTTFTRQYNSNTAVNLTAPGIIGINPFDHWKLDGGNMGSSVNLSVNMLDNHTAVAVYQGSSSGTSDFTTTKFKGKITWKAGDKYQLSNLKIAGSMDSSLVDLSFLSGQSFTNLIILNNSLALPCGEFKANKKGTAAKAKLVVDDNKITAKLKLKKGKLYLTYNNKNFAGLVSALGIPNIGTTDWSTKSADLYIAIDSSGNKIFGEGTANYNYKTKEDKKTSLK